MIDCKKENPSNLIRIFQIKYDIFDWNLTLSSNGNRISYKIDTGAQFNLIPVEILYLPNQIFKQ